MLFIVKVSPPLSSFCLAKKSLSICMCGYVYIDSVYLFTDMTYA